jgi:hypothetical protein
MEHIAFTQELKAALIEYIDTEWQKTIDTSDVDSMLLSSRLFILHHNLRHTVVSTISDLIHYIVSATKKLVFFEYSEQHLQLNSMLLTFIHDYQNPQNFVKCHEPQV